MAKLYYGDTNNTAVEINLGGEAEGAVLLNSGNMVQMVQSTHSKGWVLEKTGATPLGPTRLYLGNGEAGISMATDIDGVEPKVNLQWTDTNNNSIGISTNSSHISVEVENSHATVTLEGDDIQLQRHGVTPSAGDVWTATDTEGHGTWSSPSAGSDPNAIKIDGTSVTTAQIPFAQGISAAGSSAFTGAVTVPTPTLNEHAANKQYVDEAVASAGSGGLNYTPDVWVFSIPSSQGTSPYAYYYTESSDTPQYRKTNATFETISEHWCKLKLFFEVDCEEEKNAWPSLSPNIQAIVNAQSSTILNHYPGKSINNSYSSPIYFWGGYMDTGSSGESSVKTVETDTFTISELNGTDENAAVGWQIPDSIIPSGTNYVTTYGFWEYWIRLD